MSPYHIEYRVRFNTKSGYDDRYFGEYEDAIAFMAKFLYGRNGNVSLYVLLIGPAGLFFSGNGDVLADHYAYTLQTPSWLEILTQGQKCEGGAENDCD